MIESRQRLYAYFVVLFVLLLFMFFVYFIYLFYFSLHRKLADWGNLWPVFGGPLSFFYLTMFSVGLGISGARVLKYGKILYVPGDCSLCEMWQEVGFGDRVNIVLSMQTATTDTFSKQDV